MMTMWEVIWIFSCWVKSAISNLLLYKETTFCLCHTSSCDTSYDAVPYDEPRGQRDVSTLSLAVFLDDENQHDAYFEKKNQ